MKTIKLILFLTLFCSLNGFSQANLNVEFRVEKQSMSTPMTALDEIFFMKYYYAKPLTIKFNGSLLNMHYDNGASFAKKNVTQVSRETEFEGDQLAQEIILYTNNENVSDTISLIIDYNVGYVQIVLPTQNSKGEYVGYTSYRQFISQTELALK